jgi:broad specificity phosphatase PhoE
MSDNIWTKLYVVRHGETRWNFEGRWQGWQDSDLTETGRQQARQAAELLGDSGAHVIYSSDAGRAKETAGIINVTVGAEIKLDAALRERFYGEYEGMTSDEIVGKYPGTRYEVGRDRRDTWRPIGGESLVEVSSWSPTPACCGCLMP